MGPKRYSPSQIQIPVTTYTHGAGDQKPAQKDQGLQRERERERDRERQRERETERPIQVIYGEKPFKSANSDQQPTRTAVEFWGLFIYIHVILPRRHLSI